MKKADSSLVVALVAIGVALIGYFVWRRLRQRNRSKYGFTLPEGRRSRVPDAQSARRTFDSFLAENDSAIRDVLGDYAHTHPLWGEVAYADGQWSLGLRSGRRSAQDDCIVRCELRPSYEDGRLRTTVDIQLPAQLAERRVLLKALTRAIRKSRSGRRVTLIAADR